MEIELYERGNGNDWWMPTIFLQIGLLISSIGLMLYLQECGCFEVKKFSCRIREKEFLVRENIDSVRSIKFSSFKELTFHSNLFQRLFGLGTIYIKYEVFYGNNKAHAEVKLTNMKKARELYYELVAKTDLISKEDQYSILEYVSKKKLS
jgi:hypothetical protein